jgi:hypothetical protein
MNTNNCTIIEIVADFIFFVVIGSNDDIKNYIKNIKNKNPNDIYISLKIDVPIVNEIKKLELQYKKKIGIESGSESAQSFASAQDSYIIRSRNKTNDILSKKTFMLMVLENIDDTKMVLKFPKLELHDDDDPEVVVMNWVSNIHKIENNIIIKNIKKTIKPITLVGYKNDILVYTAKI